MLGIYQERYREYAPMYGTIIDHMTHPELQFKNSSMHCLNKLWLLFHSLCCTTWCMFEAKLVHEPQINVS